MGSSPVPIAARIVPFLWRKAALYNISIWRGRAPAYINSADFPPRNIALPFQINALIALTDVRYSRDFPRVELFGESPPASSPAKRFAISLSWTN